KPAAARGRLPGLFRGSGVGFGWPPLEVGGGGDVGGGVGGGLGAGGGPLEGGGFGGVEAALNAMPVKAASSASTRIAPSANLGNAKLPLRFRPGFTAAVPLPGLRFPSDPTACDSRVKLRRGKHKTAAALPIFRESIPYAKRAAILAEGDAFRQPGQEPAAARSARISERSARTR